MSDLQPGPIKVHTVDPFTGLIINSYIFVGNVPDNVKKELLSITKLVNKKSKQIPENKILKSHYGKSWRDKIGIDKIPNYNKKISGGSGDADTVDVVDYIERSYTIDDYIGGVDVDDIDTINNLSDDYKINNRDGKDTIYVDDSLDVNVDDSLITSVDIDIDDTAAGDQHLHQHSNLSDSDIDFDVGDTPDVDVVDVDGKTDADFTFDVNDIDESLFDKATMSNLPTRDSEKEQKYDLGSSKTNKNVKNDHISGIKYIFDITIHDIDSIEILKNKFYAYSGIPIYRQHLWCDDKNAQMYDLEMGYVKKNINFGNIISYYLGNNDMDSIEDIPIDIKYYNNKDDINIIPIDTYKTVSDFYTEHGVDDYYCVDLNDILTCGIIRKLTGKRYELELIYYGFVLIYFPLITLMVYYEFLKNEEYISEIFPLLRLNKNTLIKSYKMDEDIMNTVNESAGKTINNLSYYIQSTTLSNKSTYSYHREQIVNIRNLFNYLKLDKHIEYIRCDVIHNHKKVVLVKSKIQISKKYKFNNREKIIIRINPDNNSSQYDLVIYINGAYDIITRWRDDEKMSISSIIKIVFPKVNELFDTINRNKNLLMYVNKNIIPITVNNMVLANTKYMYQYKLNVSISIMDTFYRILEDYETANIVDFKSNTVLGKDYYFIKGIYKKNISQVFNKYSDITNVYSYLSNRTDNIRWKKYIEHTNIMNIQNLNTYLYIGISGISDDYEFNIFNNYLIGLIELFNSTYKERPSITTKNVEKLKSLKNRDPLLYNFKQIYNSDTVYSKICQKPYQPIMYDEKEFKEVKDPWLRKNAIKYKNFTTNTPVIYVCPNKKYPHIKFISNVHPKNYCIPCCKKSPMGERVNEKKRHIYNECLTKFMYADSDGTNVTKGSKYISSYGKSIYVGRLSRLPENTLEPLLFNTYFPDEEITDGKYYIYGVDQNAYNLNAIGYLYCIVHALNTTVDDFIKSIIQKIENNPNIFHLLLNGKITKYFNNVKLFKDVLLAINNKNDMIETRYKNLPWNDIIISVVYNYLDIVSFIFIDNNNIINLEIPPITTIDNIINKNKKYIVILTNDHKEYYPIYLLNNNLYKISGIIPGKIFSYTSGIISNISSIIEHYIEKFIQNNNITLFVIEKFIETVKNTPIKVIKYYINVNNLCYAVLIKYNNELVYFPVKESFYTIKDDILIDLNPYKINKHPLKSVIKLLDVFNKWLIKNHPNITPIVIEHWLLLNSNKNVIGFISNGLQYYFTPVPYKLISKVNGSSGKTPSYKTIFYNPVEVNRIIFKNKYVSNKSVIYKTEKINNAIYNYYIYDLAIIQFSTYIYGQKNTKVRTIIKNTFNQKSNKLYDVFKTQNIEIEDIETINKMLKNKKTFIEAFDNHIFKFDNYLINKIKESDYKSIYDMLKKISSKIFTIGKLSQNVSLENELVSCGNSKHCKNKKLIIPKNILENVLENVSSIIISNPLAIDWIFNPLMINNNIDFFHFTKRSKEFITINIVN